MKEDLATLGYTNDDIRNMKPIEAQDILKERKIK